MWPKGTETLPLSIKPVEREGMSVNWRSSMEIRDGGCIEMTWYGEQFETCPSCRRKQAELNRKQVELKKTS